MTTGMIIIGAVFLIGVVFIAYRLLSKKKKLKEIEELENNFTDIERQVINICNSELQINPIVPVIVIRTPTQKFPTKNGYTWFEYEEKVIGLKAHAFTDRKTIYIKRFDRETFKEESLEKFVKLYIHESNHVEGMNHGREMSAEDSKEIKKILDILNDKNII